MILTRLASGIPKINAPIVGLPRSAAVTTPAITSPPMIAFSKNSIVLFMSAAKYLPKPKGQRPFAFREIFFEHYIQIY